MKFNTVIIGGGLAGITAATILQQKGHEVAVFSAGRSLHEPDTKPFVEAGGQFFPNNKVLSARVEDDRVVSIQTAKFGEVQADEFVLCTGKFFSRGLVADMHGVREPIFNLPVKFDPDHTEWFDQDFSKPQPFMEFGVEDPHPLSNLHLCGEILAGKVDIVKSAEEICRQIG